MLWMLDEGIDQRRGALLRMLSSLEERQITHAYWKASRRLGDALEAKGDYDLLVLPDERSLWQRALEEHRFIRARTRPQNQHRQMEHWVGFCSGQPGQPSSLLHIHVHQAPLIRRKGIWEFQLGTAQAVLRSRELDKTWGVYRLNPAMEFVLLMLRAFMEEKIRPGLKGPLSPRGEADLAYILRQTSAEDIQQAARQLLPTTAGHRFGAKLAELINRGASPWAEEALLSLEAVVCEIYDKNRLTSTWRARGARTAQMMSSATQTLLQRGLPPALRPPRVQQKLCLKRAPFVAVVGIDGAGKTTLVQGLSQSLGQTLDVEQLYLGQGDLISDLWRVLAQIKRRLQRSLRPQRAADGKAADDALASESLVVMEHQGYRRRLWELSRVAMAARLLREARQARRHYNRRGTVVLSDRFPSARERYASGPAITIRPGAGPIERQWAKATAFFERALLERAVKYWAPDLILHLSLEPQTAWERKPEHRLFDLQQKAAALKRADYGKATVITVDAAQPESLVEKKAQELIWRLLSSTSSADSMAGGFR